MKTCQLLDKVILTHAPSIFYYFLLQPTKTQINITKVYISTVSLCNLHFYVLHFSCHHKTINGYNLRTHVLVVKYLNFVNCIFNSCNLKNVCNSPSTGFKLPEDDMKKCRNMLECRIQTDCCDIHFYDINCAVVGYNKNFKKSRQRFIPT